MTVGIPAMFVCTYVCMGGLLPLIYVYICTYCFVYLINNRYQYFILGTVHPCICTLYSIGTYIYVTVLVGWFSV